ncbi:MAG: indolepyruvate ferredoxin oxidoreductase family protein, partial [Actinomycetes bacterium]
MAKHSDVNLSDVFTATSGSVLMSGIQAIVRASLEQMWLDRGRGLSTGSFVSGYPGSPLGTVDMEFDRAKRYLEPANIHFHHAINEELAATAVVGTQLVDQLPGADVDGAVGYWFGKNPGLDRAADALRHGNYMGTSPLGGLVAFIGDDPSSKSSTLPSSSAEMCESMLIPAFNPSTIAEMVSYTLHGVAMSRASGTISAVRVVTELADAAAVVDLVDPATYIEAPDASREVFRATLLGARAIEAEQHLFEVRLPKTIAYAKANHLNKVTFEASRATFGIVASGTTYSSLLRAFEILGVDDQALEQMGIRLIKIGLIWPLDHQEFRDFTEGLQTVFVIEDKRPFLELHIRDALYGAKNLPL